MRMTAVKKTIKHSPSSILKDIKKMEEKYLELGWELQCTEGLIFILILLGGNRGRRTGPNQSVIQPKQMCWHDSGVFQKYQESFWLWNTCWSTLSGSLISELVVWGCSAVKEKQIIPHSSIRPWARTQNNQIQLLCPLCHTSHLHTALGESLSR